MTEIIHGVHAIRTLANQDPNRIREVYLTKGQSVGILRPLIRQLVSSNILIKKVSRQWLDKKTGGAVHQGIIANITPSKNLTEQDLTTILKKQITPFLLILDGVIDPRNFGACLRCADAAGVHAVIVRNSRAAPLNAAARKVASGAGDTVPLIRVKNLMYTLRLLQQKNIWIVGTDNISNRLLYHSTLTGPLALLVGEEHKGIRCVTRQFCDDVIRIPMAGSVSSLNVSVATGICLFEAVRQRTLSGL